jgi:two-component system sensor histidine kinase FlrB
VGDEVLLTVTDDGPGVDTSIVDQMFEPFATNTPDGTGLGLAIAAYVLQLHKGRISYRKHATRGACFQIALRRIPASS